ncbi:3,4-dihydroxy-2-butanone-4-phosphate synthase [Candidatus Woesearchaeota archaeon]|nr:3,4-dihydroxy-2-butanone-4-phosphate synthase [Candidatus Woesearchaeota archaeon]
MDFSNIKSTIGDFKKGKFVVVVDDEHRENEADLVLAAEKTTPEKINFMIKNARGLVCVPMLGKRLDELELPMMVKKNTEFTKCAFTVSVDAKKGTTTGISAYDRARTIKALVDSRTKPSDLARPGHVFPLRCDSKGLTSRPGHTEASIELCRLAGLYPAAVICEIVGENGKMARMPEVRRMAKKFNLKVIRINDLIEFLNYGFKLNYRNL